MKIIYLANYRLPTEKAHGIQIAKMCEALGVSGVSVELVYPRRITEIADDMYTYYSTVHSFESVQLRVSDLVDRVPFGFIATSLSFTASAYGYLKKNKVRDWVYCRDVFALLAAVLYGKASIAFELHSLPKRFSILHRMLMRKVTRFVTVNDLLREELLQKLPHTGARILTAHDGVDLDSYARTCTREECRKALGIPSEQNVVLYAGHLYPWKGVYTLVDASVLFPEGTLLYLIGGTDHDLRIMRSYLQQKHITKTKVFGHHRPQEIPQYLCAADIVVLPNTATNRASRLYTSPMKLFEYMASGRPIVASDVPSLREILNDENALFVSPDDPHAIAAGVQQLVQDPVKAKRIADRAMSEVTKYSWTTRAARIVSFLKDGRS